MLEPRGICIHTYLCVWHMDIACHSPFLNSVEKGEARFETKELTKDILIYK